jgi:hypothetical protein
MNNSSSLNNNSPRNNSASSASYNNNGPNNSSAADMRALLEHPPRRPRGTSDVSSSYISVTAFREVQAARRSGAGSPAFGVSGDGMGECFYYYYYFFFFPRYIIMLY